MIGIAFMLSFSACEDEAEGPRNNMPVANAGQEITISQGQQATLDGSSSSDQDGDNLTYSWVFKSKPEGSQSIISDANSAIAKFTPDLEGEYVAELTVNDGQGGISKAEVKIIVNPTQVSDDGCRLLSVLFEDSDDELSFEYNEDGYVISSYYDDNDLPPTYEYNSDNLMIRINYNGIEEDYSTFTYEEGILSEQKLYRKNGELVTSFKYTYDEQGRLIEETSSGGSKITYAYDNRGNVIKEDYFNNNTLIRSITSENYDDKKNFYLASKGLPVTESSYINLNNYTKQTFTEYNGSSANVSIINYTYVYNESGYPIEARAESDNGDIQNVIMEYDGCE
tara:strand:- start:2312 stop:3325 length:1014 start_codon:yes stop_codon:yes gene_type:complete